MFNTLSKYTRTQSINDDVYSGEQGLTVPSPDVIMGNFKGCGILTIDKKKPFSYTPRL